MTGPVRRSRLLALGALVAFVVVGCERGVKESDILARVGDRVLDRESMEVAGMPERTRYDDVRRAVETWVATQLLAQEARRRGLSENPRIVEELNRLRDELLATEALRLLLPDTFHVTEQEIEEFYEQNRESFRRDEEEVRLVVAFVSQATLANDIYRRASAGEDMAALARNYSEGPWKERGGDTGVIPLRTLPDKLRSRVARARTGQLLRPLKLEDGYAVVKVVAKYESGSIRGLEEVRSLIELELKNQKYRKAYVELVRDLSSRTEVWINEEFLRKGDQDSVVESETLRAVVPATE